MLRLNVLRGDARYPRHPKVRKASAYSRNDLQRLPRGQTPYPDLLGQQLHDRLHFQEKADNLNLKPGGRTSPRLHKTRTPELQLRPGRQLLHGV